LSIAPYSASQPSYYDSPLRSAASRVTNTTTNPGSGTPTGTLTGADGDVILDISNASDNTKAGQTYVNAYGQTTTTNAVQPVANLANDTTSSGNATTPLDLVSTATQPSTKTIASTTSDQAADTNNTTSPNGGSTVVSPTTQTNGPFSPVSQYNQVSFSTPPSPNPNHPIAAASGTAVYGNTGDAVTYRQTQPSLLVNAVV
jgi:hypothetical protein